MYHFCKIFMFCFFHNFPSFWDLEEVFFEKINAIGKFRLAIYAKNDYL